ncbi:hypothetical protein K0B96_01725 [Horticoccus luteus]|uniref:Alpha-L-rhamnosidase n=1 Tax=Horticoccus luteus TaxID=2862869 RepID=A0A8F9TW27_9BACT|nr:alpha-L-rhamnosidase C-terminal domain-containing protein [Horticoccus luteus]QYM79363.1 hypothetical protein K0B96_01725 [Horticoccus luteus]
MLFAPFAGEGVCRRIATPALAGGTPNMEPRGPLDEAAWLWHRDLGAGEPAQVLFRLEFTVAAAETVRLQVSADLCYALALDGALIARGPDSSDVAHWAWATYELALTAGAHRLEALVWWGRPPVTPEGRVGWRGGFVCAGLGDARERFTTGVGLWRAALLGGVKWQTHAFPVYHVIGRGAVIDWAKCDAEGAEWTEPAVVRGPVEFHECGIAARGWSLEASALPEQRHDWWAGGRVRAVTAKWSGGKAVRFRRESGADEPGAAGWAALVRGAAPLTLAARAEATVLIDTEDYLCGFPLLEYEGGAGTVVRWEWAEGLFERLEGAVPPKGQRDEIAGKFFHGFGERWMLAGGRRRWAGAPWWRAGRYIMLSVKVGAEPVVLHAWGVERTGFLLRRTMALTTSDETLGPVVALSERGLRACMHDVFVDCPYYEQMMYVADTRVQILLAYVFGGEERLARRGMELFDFSRGRGGWPAMRTPSGERQESGTFAMIWPWMLHDYALWRDDGAWLRTRLPGLRALMEGLVAESGADGLLTRPPGWLFMDWVPEWKAGWAPGTRVRPGRKSALVNLQFLLTLQRAAELETWVGDESIARRWREGGARTAAALAARFWDEARGVWADDESHESFSQHAQALAVIAGLRVPEVGRWADATANGLAAATIYFQHYLFEALGRAGRADLILPRLDLWRGLVKQGFKTPVESPEPARSDCHAWGAHPVFHLQATIAGVRPVEPGFRRVRIAPQPGTLTQIETELPHPRGLVKMRADFEGARVEAIITLPPETTGVFAWRGQEVELRSGVQRVTLGV